MLSSKVVGVSYSLTAENVTQPQNVGGVDTGEDVRSKEADHSIDSQLTADLNNLTEDPQVRVNMDTLPPVQGGQPVTEPPPPGDWPPKALQGVNDLSLVGVNYTVTYREGNWWKGCCLRKKVSRDILKDVDVHLTSGQLTAVLGNSGSGKTSLLDVISNKADGKVQGDILFNHTKLNRKVFRGVGGYVIQADRLLPNLTVHETLSSTAQLKFLGKLSQDKIRQKVDEVIEEMSLRHVTNSRIGGYIERGISGGEKRRVSIAVQLLQDPYILLLDEPTTGLDSFTAHNLVQSLATLAHTHNKIVLLTVHQPRSDIFKLFDNVGLLCQGQVVYFGPRKELVPYFTQLGYPCPIFANPLDHYVDLASVDHRSSDREALTLGRVADLRHQYCQSAVFAWMTGSLQDASSSPTEDDLILEQTKSASVCLEARYLLIRTCILLKRMTLQLARDRGGMIMRLCAHTIFACYIWLFLWQLGHDLPSAIQDRSGLMYQTVSVSAMIGVLNATSLLPPFRNVYYRESGDGLYGCVELCVAYYLHTLPYHIISSVGYAIWVYWGVGMYPEWDRFAIFYAVLVFLEHLGELTMLLSLALFNSPQLAQSVSTLLITAPVLYASGLLKTFDTMLVPVQWLAYLSFIKYSTEILVTNEYHQLNFTCPEEPDLPCGMYTGDLYLKVFFPNGVENMGFNFGILGIFVVGFWILGILIFKIKGERHLQ